jgi:RNA polymerase subunit RPABC4/transcription elongation factor Spt4
MVQITTRERPASGGQTALTVTLHGVEDSLAVQVSKQAWLGVAASLGVTALAALRNPYSLLSRLDDLAQDIENLSLREEIWEVVDNVARLRGATLELSDRLRRMVCEYCETANPVGEPSCIACGAPLGDIQPSTCPSCGFVVKSNEKICPNCSQAL